ncbi:MAG: hypothetical protein ACE5JR_13510 [Gemmatimonadota bacterium]
MSPAPRVARARRAGLLPDHGSGSPPVSGRFSHDLIEPDDQTLQDAAPPRILHEGGRHVAVPGPLDERPPPPPRDRLESLVGIGRTGAAAKESLDLARDRLVIHGGIAAIRT